MTIRKYNLSRNVEPTMEAIRLIETYFPTIHTELLELAASGSHVLNPYHNLKHELQHVYWAHSCLMNSSASDDLGNAEVLILASLFHDHNHSGGKQKDTINIERATDFVALHVPNLVAYTDDGVVRTWGTDYVMDLIECTMFVDGKFAIEPEDLCQKCMRDADLMAIYTGEGRNLLLGLYEELGIKLSNLSDDDFMQALDKNDQFLRNAEMFTLFGRQVKEDHLERSLAAFRVRATDYRKWSHHSNDE